MFFNIEQYTVSLGNSRNRHLTLFLLASTIDYYFSSIVLEHKILFMNTSPSAVSQSDVSPSNFIECKIIYSIHCTKSDSIKSDIFSNHKKVRLYYMKWKIFII